MLSAHRPDNVTEKVRPALPLHRGCRATSLRILLLGPLEVFVADRLVAVDTRKALAIVALVAAEARPFARDELAAMFWPEADDEAARGVLRRTLSALRSAVDDPVSASSEPGSSWSRGQRRPGRGRATWPRRGPAPTSRPPRRWPWAVPRRVRAARQPGLRRLAGGRGSRVERHRRRACSSDSPRLAGSWATAQAPSKPPAGGWSSIRSTSRASDGVMELMARSGDRAGAIRQYRSLVALFDRELGVAPLRETTELYEAIRGGPGRPRPRLRPRAVRGRALGRRRRVPVIGRATADGRGGRARCRTRFGLARRA